MSYIHYLNHPLHFVVVVAIKGILSLATFFFTVRIHHNFIKLSGIVSLHKWLKSPYLMEWSDHFIVIASGMIKRSLQYCWFAHSSDSNTHIETIGILRLLCSKMFISIFFALDIFHEIRPADNQLQSRNCNIHHVIELLKIAKRGITIIRESDGWWVSETNELLKRILLRNAYVKKNMRLNIFSSEHFFYFHRWMFWQAT